MVKTIPVSIRVSTSIRGAREYDPHTGRWTTKDPILFAGRDTNLHTITRIVAAICVLVLSASASASSPTIVPQHAVLVTDDDKKQQLRVLFARSPS